VLKRKGRSARSVSRSSLRQVSAAPGVLHIGKKKGERNKNGQRSDAAQTFPYCKPRFVDRNARKKKEKKKNGERSANPAGVGLGFAVRRMPLNWSEKKIRKREVYGGLIIIPFNGVAALGL